MAEYLHRILATGIFVACAVLLSPDGANGRIGKYISFIGSLTVAVVILLPLLNILGSYTFADSRVESEDTNKGERSAEYYANSAGIVISELYEIPLSDIRAEVRCSDDGEIVQTVMYLNNEVIFDEKEAGDMLSNIFGMDIRVVRDE